MEKNSTIPRGSIFNFDLLLAGVLVGEVGVLVQVQVVQVVELVRAQVAIVLNVLVTWKQSFSQC